MITIAYIVLGLVVATIAEWAVENWFAIKGVVTGKAIRFD